jgi:hypothetical protein
LILCLLVTFSTFAQRFKGGILLGMSASQVDGDTQKGFNKLGLFSGVSVSTDFTKTIGTKIELYYIGKGAKQNNDGVEVFKSKLHYVEMPFLLTFKPVNHFQLDLGLACSYLISSKLFEMGAEVTDGLNNMHNFDLGGIASGSYYFSKNLGFNVRMDYSITPIKNNPNWYNYNLSFGLVYQFNNKQ